MSKAIWARPGLRLPDDLDTVVFDMDGVLWDGQISCSYSVVDTVAYLLQNEYGLAEFRQVTLDEIAAFKRAGGFNDDWDLSWALTITRLAAARGHWGGKLPTPEVLAAESRGEGVAWAEKLVPERDRPSHDLAREVFNEFYWGAERYREVFGKPASHVTAPGYIRMERPLVSPDFFDRLRESGIRHVGIATGRHSHEMPKPAEELRLAEIVPESAIITSDEVQKPDPAMLQRAVNALGGRAGLFVGDTKDDLEMVLRWRKSDPGDCIPFWAVMVAPEPTEQEFYKGDGADILIGTADVLPEVIQELRANHAAGTAKTTEERNR